MTSAQPRIGYPRLGIPAESALDSAGLSLPTQPPLPSLIEPTEPAVTDPIDELMIRVEDLHPNIDVVPHYALGGWTNAIGECWLRSGVATRLRAAADALPEAVGLVVYDGWRPRKLQKELYMTALADPAIPPGFLAEPSSDDVRPAPHESGGAVDLALTVNGVAVAPGTDFDDTTTQAFAAALEDTPGPDRDARRMLYWVMRNAGFVVYEGEWWHFEYGTRRWAAILNRSPIYDATRPPA
jgi:D-alanyl-D-alanine dipeptidase